MTHIKLNKVGLTFSIYNAKTRSIRHEIMHAIGGKVKQLESTVYIKALNNIDLGIKEGDRVGLIGHNGAGKSTLLKVLAGIYEPTEGYIEHEGKISSLTDVTMGMDTESTGYDNIIMRCIFMGMTFKEAKEKASKIIEFSGLSEYINLPTRTYSTGMFLRLAFAISTSVVPDILIMDEMIGAGDAAFIEKARKRSLEMIEKTKIMVISSHDPHILKEICTRGIWMEKGTIKREGLIGEVITEYNDYVKSMSS